MLLLHSPFLYARYTNSSYIYFHTALACLYHPADRSYLVHSSLKKDLYFVFYKWEWLFIHHKLSVLICFTRLWELIEIYRTGYLRDVPTLWKPYWNFFIATSPRYWSLSITIAIDLPKNCIRCLKLICQFFNTVPIYFPTFLLLNFRRLDWT